MKEGRAAGRGCRFLKEVKERLPGATAAEHAAEALRTAQEKLLHVKRAPPPPPPPHSDPPEFVYGWLKSVGLEKWAAGIPPSIPFAPAPRPTSPPLPLSGQEARWRLAGAEQSRQREVGAG